MARKPGYVAAKIRAHTTRRARENPIRTAALRKAGGVIEGKRAEVYQGLYTGTWRFLRGGWHFRLPSDIKPAAARRRFTKAAGAKAPLLYALQQYSGLPEAAVLADVAEEPRRLLSLKDLGVPKHARDRRVFSRALLTTWSPRAAMAALLPNVEGAHSLPPRLAGDPGGVRYALNQVRSWKQKVPTAGAFGDLGERARYSRIPPEVFRKLLRKMDPLSLRAVVVIPSTIRQRESTLAQSREGHRLLVELSQENWDKLLTLRTVRDLNALLLGHDHEGMTEKDVERRNRDLVRPFELTPGVTPLIKRSDFLREGYEMGHSAAGSFAHKVATFSIIGPEGSRATLDVQDGQVIQFRGPGNFDAGSDAVARARGFLLHNKVELYEGWDEEL